MAVNAIEAAGALCVITAADIEFKTIAKLLSGGRSTVEDGLQLLRSQPGTRAVTLLKSEIGAVGFAEKLRAHLVRYPYKALVVIGLAGALDPALRTGDVVLYDRCLDGRDLPQPTSRHNRKYSEAFCNAELTRRLFESFIQQELPCQRHSGLSVERVVIEAQQKRALYAQTQAGAVDMETYLILAAVADFKQPCVAIRVVMDEAVSDLPDFNAGLDVAGRVQLWPTVLALAASPRTTITFMLTLRPALRNLERVAHAVFKAFNSR